MPVADPYMMQNKQKFDQQYLKDNQDVAKDGTMDPYTHYMRHGKGEGRKYGDGGGLIGNNMMQKPQGQQQGQNNMLLSKDQFFGLMPGVMEMPDDVKENIYSRYQEWLSSGAANKLMR